MSETTITSGTDTTTYADGEVVGLDNDGCIILWNSETKRGENSGMTPTQFGATGPSGMSNVERVRIGLKPVDAAEVARLVGLAEAKDNEQALDDLVDDNTRGDGLSDVNEAEGDDEQEDAIERAEKRGSDINNSGYEVQICYLLEAGVTAADIEKAISESAYS